MTLGEPPDEVGGQERDVFGPLAQRRHEDREYVEPVEEIGAKSALLNHCLEVLVRRRDDSNVHRRRAAAAAESFDLLLLQRPQQLGLQFQRQVTDLVKEQRAAIRSLKSSNGLRHGSGKRSSFIAEEFALEQTCQESRRS